MIKCHTTQIKNVYKKNGYLQQKLFCKNLFFYLTVAELQFQVEMKKMFNVIYWDGEWIQNCDGIKPTRICCCWCWKLSSMTGTSQEAENKLISRWFVNICFIEQGREYQIRPRKIKNKISFSVTLPKNNTHYRRSHKNQTKHKY